MRLFVAVHLPEAVLDQVAEVVAGFPAHPRMRPTTRPQWHVTMRFLGEVEDPAPVIAALDGAELPAADASLGPSTHMLGRGVVCVSVGGLEDLAGAVVAATGGFGQPPDDRPFHGHLTLARLKRGVRRRDIPDLLGCPISAQWPVGEVALVRSHLGSAGATYEDLHVVSLR